MKAVKHSKTIQFFALVFLGGGADIIINLVQQEEIDWRSAILASVALAGIALRLTTTQPIK